MKLVPINEVFPSAYNPRHSDPARLDLIELSLRKLGFLVPLYADANGEILSGHQRHLVAKRLGVTHVPVEYTEPMELAKRQSVNVVFNRATNDLKKSDTAASLTEAIAKSNVYEIAAHLPDLRPFLDGIYGFYPCMNAVDVPTTELAQVNGFENNDYAYTLSKSLINLTRRVMPLICTADNRLVNGIGRLQYGLTQGMETMRVVYISDSAREFAHLMMNYLSMDFDLENRYKDLLRHNSFRRARQPRTMLGPGKIHHLIKASTKTNAFDISVPEHQQAWTRFYGTRVLDFGAGRFDEVNLLREAGVDAIGFEPYCLQNDSDELDLALTRQRAVAFLEQVAAGKVWHTIFCNAVFNSVPFEQDRHYIVTLIHALATPQTRVVTHTRSLKDYKKQTSELLSETQAGSILFKVEYEENMTLGEFSKSPKVQKFFGVEEFANYWRRKFMAVEAADMPRSASVSVIAAKPKALDLSELKAAIAHEFNLPFPDDQRMGLVAEALDAFGKRLGVQLC